MKKSLGNSIHNFFKVVLLGVVMTLCVHNANAQVSVTATVGTLGPTAYTTLRAAVLAINAGTHRGVINVSITGNTTETAMSALASSGTGASSYTAITIKPAPATTPVISGSINNAILQLLGADNVTVDGSNTVGGTTRDLTIKNNSTGANAVVLWIASASGANGATNNVIKNTNITGSTPSTTVAGLVTGSNVLGNAAAAPNSGNVIQNNNFSSFQNGIYLFGYAFAPYDPDWVIKGNTFSNTGFRGMILQNASNFDISSNNISAVTIAFAGNISTGIQLSSEFDGGNIYNNVVSDISQTAAASGCNGIGLLATTTASNVNVYNNFVFGVRSLTGSTTLTGPFDNGYGIFVGTGGGYNIYHNTVVMNINQTSGFLSTPLNVAAGVSLGTVDVRDNILINSQTAGATNRPAIFTDAGSGVFSNIDYNDYVAGTGVLGRIGTVDCSTLPAMVLNFGGNTNSISVSPSFVSGTDFHLQPLATNIPLVAGLAITTPLINRDIDTDPRPASTPTIGADEFGNVMGYPALPATCSVGDIVLTPDTISSGVGIPTTGPLMPRIYYRKNAGPWLSSAGTFLSGTANKSIWSFTIPAVAFGGVAGGDVISYYVVAQTNSGVVFGRPSGGLVASDVNTVTTPPSFPFTYNVNAVSFSMTTTDQTVCYNTGPAYSVPYAYTIATGAPSQYTLSWAPAGPTNVAAFTALPASPLNVNVPSLTAVNNYTATLTLKNPTTGCTSSNTFLLHVVATPTPIIGSPNTCPGVVSTLSDITLFGTWSASNANVTIGATTGIMTGMALGTSIITYTLPCGIVTKVVTVNVPPPPIVGRDTVCLGGTTAFANIDFGGSWSSSNIAIATTLSSSGLITGVGLGTATITYSKSNGCFAAKNVRVIAPPPPSTGTMVVCPGTTTNLFNSTAGGTWSSEQTFIATVGSTSGVVTGVSADTVGIIYTAGTGCSSRVVVTVNPAPAAIVGEVNHCAGVTDTLYDPTPGGTWSSSVTGVATIDPITGIVNTINGGSTTITYKLAGSGCIATKVVTVDILPAVPITYNYFTNSYYTLNTFPSYQWYDNFGLIPSANTYLTAAQYNGVYYVRVGLPNGCIGESAHLTYNISMLSTTQLGTIQVSVYPNPSTGMLYIDAPVTVKAIVTGVDGKTEIEQNNAKQIDLSNLADGLYFVVLYDNAGNAISHNKIVKRQAK